MARELRAQVLTPARTRLHPGRARHGCGLDATCCAGTSPPQSCHWSFRSSCSPSRPRSSSRRRWHSSASATSRPQVGASMLSMAHSRNAFLTDAWLWWVLPPGIAIAITVLAFALLGNAIEERSRPILVRRRMSRRSIARRAATETPLTGEITVDRDPLVIENLTVVYGDERSRRVGRVLQRGSRRTRRAGRRVRQRQVHRRRGGNGSAAGRSADHRRTSPGVRPRRREHDRGRTARTSAATASRSSRRRHSAH